MRSRRTLAASSSCCTCWAGSTRYACWTCDRIALRPCGSRRTSGSRNRFTLQACRTCNRFTLQTSRSRNRFTLKTCRTCNRFTFWSCYCRRSTRGTCKTSSPCWTLSSCSSCYRVSCNSCRSLRAGWTCWTCDRIALRACRACRTCDRIALRACSSRNRFACRTCSSRNRFALKTCWTCDRIALRACDRKSSSSCWACYGRDSSGGSCRALKTSRSRDRITFWSCLAVQSGGSCNRGTRRSCRTCDRIALKACRTCNGFSGGTRLSLISSSSGCACWAYWSCATLASCWALNLAYVFPTQIIYAPHPQISRDEISVACATRSWKFCFSSYRAKDVDSGARSSCWPCRSCGSRSACRSRDRITLRSRNRRTCRAAASCRTLRTCRAGCSGWACNRVSLRACETCRSRNRRTCNACRALISLRASRASNSGWTCSAYASCWSLLSRNRSSCRAGNRCSCRASGSRNSRI